jgi:hypothetical protein
VEGRENKERGILLLKLGLNQLIGEWNPKTKGDRGLKLLNKKITIHRALAHCRLAALTMDTQELGRYLELLATKPKHPTKCRCGKR